jgi:predicted RNA-binding protein with RPS1 domain
MAASMIAGPPSPSLTKYTSSQGLLHDSVYVHLVYEVVDFSDVDGNPDLSAHAREKQREKRVKERKKDIENRLKHFQKLHFFDTFGKSFDKYCLQNNKYRKRKEPKSEYGKQNIS